MALSVLLALSVTLLSAADGVGGAMLTFGLEKMDELAKKFGIAVAPVEAVVSGFGGTGLGGMSEIDGTAGNSEVVGTASATFSSFAEGESVD